MIIGCIRCKHSTTVHFIKMRLEQECVRKERKRKIEFKEIKCLRKQVETLN